MNPVEKYRKVSESGLKVLGVRDLAVLFRLPLPSARVAASRLISRGLLRRLRKDLYVPVGGSLEDFEIANRLLEPSYISFETALNFWGLSAQIPRVVFSASLRSKTYRMDDLEFRYLRLPPPLFRFGFAREGSAFVAQPEKALLDTAYYASLGRIGGRTEISDELAFRKIDRKRLKQYSLLYPPKTRELLARYFQ